jgi:hypothetical protein
MRVELGAGLKRTAIESGHRVVMTLHLCSPSSVVSSRFEQILAPEGGVVLGQDGGGSAVVD